MSKTTEFKIEKGFSIPKAKKKYPFSTMEVGDSFLVGNDNLKSIRSSAYNYASKNHKKFAVRETPEGHRCWRIK